MTQLILHLIGDYLTQSHWMAENKTRRSWPAFVHATIYALPFLLLRPSWIAFSVILGTHFLIDRYRLARYLVWFKNVVGNPDSHRHGWPSAMVAEELIGPSREFVAELLRTEGYSADAAQHAHHARWCWKSCSATGFPADAPPWLATGLLIVADNTLHLAINYAALRWL